MDIKKIIKEELSDFGWVDDAIHSSPETEEELALSKCYGYEFLDGLELRHNRYYDLPLYTNDGGYYVVAQEHIMTDVLREYYKDLVDNITLGEWNRDFIDPYDYITYNDEQIDKIVDELSFDQIINYSNDDKVEGSSVEDEYITLVQRMAELDGWEDEWFDLFTKREELLDIASQEKLEKIRKDIFTRLSRVGNLTSYLVGETGYYDDVDDIIDKGLGDIDLDSFIEDLVNEKDFGQLSMYDDDFCRVSVNNNSYICIRIE